jgi:hypothetical protein
MMIITHIKSGVALYLLNAATNLLKLIKSLPKLIKRLLKIFLWIVLALLLIGVSLLFAVRLSKVQTFLAQQVAEYFSEELKTRITVGRLSVGFFDKVSLHELYIEDQAGDTLLYCDELKVNIDAIRFKTHELDFDLIQLNNAHFYLKTKLDSTGKNNLGFIIDYFTPTQKDSLPAPKWSLYSDEIKFNDSFFKLKSSNAEEKAFGVNFNDLDVKNVNVALEKVEFISDTLYAYINHISLQEKSGFNLDTLQGFFNLSSGELKLSELKLVTPQSSIKGELSFEYNNFIDFREFIDSVQIRTQIDDSKLNFSDISYFAPELEGFSEQIVITGQVRGSISNLRGRQLQIEFSDNSFFTGDIALNGLPNIERTNINLNIKKLTTTISDLEKIQIPPFKENNHLIIPQEFNRLGNIALRGQFTGFYNDFVAFGEMRSDIGTMATDLGISQSETTKVISYLGQIKATDFNLGRLFDIKDLGILSANVNIDGQGITLNTINADVAGEVQQIVFRNFSYEKLKLNGQIEKDLFNGHAVLDDEDISFDFDGLIDLRRDTARFDFVSNIYHANFGALNLIEIEEYSSFTSRIEMNLQGVAVDDFTGKILALQTSFCYNDIEYPFGNVTFNSNRSKTGNSIYFSSDILDAEVIGVFEIASLPNSFLNILNSVMPSLLKNDEPLLVKQQNFTFSAQVKNFELVNELLVPGLYLEQGTSLSGFYNSNNLLFGLKMDTELFEFKSISIEDIHLEIDKQSEVLTAWLHSNHFPLADSLDLKDVDFKAKIYQDNIEADLLFKDQNNAQSNLGIEGEVLGRRKFDFDISPSQISLLSEVWQSDSLSSISIDTTSVTFTNFEFRSESGLVRLDGTISEDFNEKLDFELREFNLQLVNRLTTSGVPKFSGIVNSKGNIESAYKDNAINCFVDIRDLMLDDYALGDVLVDARWNFQQAQLDINGYLKYRQNENVAIKGTYNPRNKGNKLDVEVSFSQFDLAILNYLIKTGVSDFEGKVNGVIDVGGSFTEPLLSGELNLDRAGVKIDFLNTKYFVSSKVTVANDYLGLDYVPVTDQEGNKGNLIGTLFHRNFRELNYNFVIEMEKFLCLNTTMHDNDLFYGKAYATGSVDILGYGRNMQIEVSATTNSGSTFYLPLGGTTEVSFDNFVSFVSAQDAQNGIQETFDLAGISLIMDLRVTPDLQVELVFDERLGDVMKARGSGPINLEITPDGQFSMFGRYEVEEGEYLFTLQNIINKKFSIQKGGVIGWYGDPYNADIDITAIYKLRASLYELMGEFAEGYTSRVPVNLKLSLTNKLLNPNVDFSVELPNADESMQSLVNSVLSTEEEKNKQAFALLVLNKFLPPSNRAATASGSSTSFGAATTTEVLSNQLSNWLSQISEDVNVGLNYRPGDNITNEELAVALSTQLLNNRLLISGSVGVSNSPSAVSSNRGNQMIGDFLVEYLFTEDGKIRLKVFSESADYNILQTYRTGTTQGLGLTFQEDFDNFADFVCRLRNLSRKKGEKVSCDDLY